MAPLLKQLQRDLNYCFRDYAYHVAVLTRRSSGITRQKREQELIVSLTTIPRRIGKVHLCIESLLRQNLKPDRLVLWICESQIGPDALPPMLKKLRKRGLEIRWHHELRSYMKIIPALKAFPGSLIVTADDDLFYPKNWLGQLYEAYRKEPQFIHCHRAHLMRYDFSGNILPYNDWLWEAGDDQGPSLDLFPTGVGGVLYAPGHLSPEVFNEREFLAHCPKADDVWLKAMSLLHRVPCRKVRPRCFPMTAIRIRGDQPLSEDNVANGGNDLQIAKIRELYGVFQTVENE